MFRLYSWDLISVSMYYIPVVTMNAKHTKHKSSTLHGIRAYFFVYVLQHHLFLLIAMSNTPSQKAFSLTSLSIPDVSSPYFLHSANHPGVILVFILLNGDNYPTWKRAMKMTLNATNKLSFVNGVLSKITSSTSKIQLWEHYSEMVLSWILNSIDKSIVSSLIYHEYPRDVWLDLEDCFLKATILKFSN
jgi:hypothetical protein